ncbi:hypothetical protein O7623_16370 [Solwaraspora sp. WMMD791]|uniref:hypothetical protein n=1 Tax=Solwaraspora sp. WMMD791 TaxID=3016086 RepID=UPI00249A61D9|nr:hypothetical protein [Solwaraspora sp. WMMD791]WFE25001.1 hypothetical protein O7623_16370 [Solwaraspora sp. WMMD791]
MIVFGLDVGHTDPQLIVPIGGLARIDVAARRTHVCTTDPSVAAREPPLSLNLPDDDNDGSLDPFNRLVG